MVFKIYSQIATWDNLSDIRFFWETTEATQSILVQQTINKPHFSTTLSRFATFFLTLAQIFRNIQRTYAASTMHGDELIIDKKVLIKYTLTKHCIRCFTRSQTTSSTNITTENCSAECFCIRYQPLVKLLHHVAKENSYKQIPVESKQTYTFQ